MAGTGRKPLNTPAWGSLGLSEATFDIETQPCSLLAAGENKNGQLAAAGNFISFGVLEILLCTPVYSSPQIDIDLL